MKDLSTVEHFAPSENLVKILMKKTRNESPLFFRILVAYYFSKAASIMRTSIKTHDRGVIPVNLYGINLAPSGTGKGYSTDIVEDEVMHLFYNNFKTLTFPAVSDRNLEKMSLERAGRTGEDYDDCLKDAQKTFADAGPLFLSFDSATAPAIKQMRTKLLMANAGAVNLEMDEIGNNLVGNIEALNTFLELFDVGKVKSKLTKHTNDNKRMAEILGRTPTNMMLFGTPTSLLDPGSAVEEAFMKMLAIGYARRCFFGFSKEVTIDRTMDHHTLYKLKTDPQNEVYLAQLASDLGNLANPINFGIELEMTEDVAKLNTEYEVLCTNMAADIPIREEARRAEMQHRFAKALKLSGTYAFIDGKTEILEEHMYQAIKVTEESGDAFTRMLQRPKPHQVLAEFIVESDTELTLVDLVDNLTFFKTSKTIRESLMTLAISYGYRNNIVIQRTFMDGIEFFSGESMPITDTSKMKISYSQNWTTDFIHTEAPFDDLAKLIQAEGYHYAAHKFREGYRDSAHMIQGFNLAILDVDSGVSLATAMMLLKDYKAIFSTTKRHSEQENRFRIILPLSHTVKLDQEEYSHFMDNIFMWLPFTVDDQTKDCARKWEAHNGEYYQQDGILLDVMPFIPHTTKAQEQTKRILDAEDLGSLERWFHLNTNNGNRNNQILRYGLALVDSGQPLEDVRKIVHVFNNKLKYPLPADEINQTVMVTVANAILKR